MFQDALLVEVFTNGVRGHLLAGHASLAGSGYLCGDSAGPSGSGLGGIDA